MHSDVSELRLAQGRPGTVLAVVSACDLAKHRKALRGRTPLDAVRHAWTSTPDILTINPRHLSPGPNT